MLDEIELDNWDSRPPYLTDPPLNTPHKVQFTE